MPIYEYECAACRHRFEALQKISDKPLKQCPECGKPKLHKLMSAPSFRLKGGGWYETDFKSGNKKNLADGGKGEKPADKGGNESAQPTSAKPATAEPAKPAKAEKPKADMKKAKPEKTKAKEK
jgi:putative FmdB family regulatory protein